MAGRPLTIGREVNISDALLYAFHPGTMGGPADRQTFFRQGCAFRQITRNLPKGNRTNPPFTTTTPSTDARQAEVKRISSPSLWVPNKLLWGNSFYLDAGKDPLFPFGYGLSYTTFAYAPVIILHSIYPE